MATRVAALTHGGLVRSHNEDAFVADGTVFAVADGMGGHERGEVASAMVVATLGELARDSPGAATTCTKVAGALADAQVNVERISGGAARAAGSTVAGAALVGGPANYQWMIFHIGDSRVYRLAHGTLELLTIDHSLVQELVDSGNLTPAQARTSPHRNVITRALGSPDHEPSVRTIRVAPGERIMMCTDGLTNELSDAEIRQVLLAVPDTEMAVRTLVQNALDHGGRDNVSVVLVDVDASDADGPVGEDPGEGASDAPSEDTAPSRRREGAGTHE
ncbi:protein phosphatase 2C domain-containing protein [Rarobacter incanus]